MGEVEVQGDIVGLVLVPVPTGSVAARVRVSTDSPPAQIRLTFSSNEGSERRRILARAPRFEFQLSDLEPGSYRIATNSRDVYIKGISRGDEIVSADDFPQGVPPSAGPRGHRVAALCAEFHRLCSPSQPGHTQTSHRY